MQIILNIYHIFTDKERNTTTTLHKQLPLVLVYIT